MSLEFILMRHAKSSWSDPCLADHDRPLNARGRASARAVGNWLRENGPQPQQTLCSSAMRTRETFELLALDSEVSYLDALYHASEDRMLQILQNKARAKSVLMLGHNPGAAFFANAIVETPLRDEAFALFPTAACLKVCFDVDTWRDVRFGTGKAEAFIVPRRLLPPA